MLLLPAVAVLFAVLFLFVILNSQQTPDLDSSVTIRNNTPIDISSGYLIVCSKKHDIPHINSGLSYTIRFNAQSESDYEVVIRFSDSRVIHQKLGYVTFDMKFSDSILVSPLRLTLYRPEPVPTGKIYQYIKQHSEKR